VKLAGEDQWTSIYVWSGTSSSSPTSCTSAARLSSSTSAKPALSKQIRKLEDFVGEPLLVRDSRHVRLTLRGQRFLEDARQ
jgi:hypothetical protein